MLPRPTFLPRPDTPQAGGPERAELAGPRRPFVPLPHQELTPGRERGDGRRVWAALAPAPAPSSGLGEVAAASG